MALSPPRIIPKPVITLFLILIIFSSSYYYLTYFKLYSNLPRPNSMNENFPEIKSLLEDQMVIPMSEIVKGNPIILAQNETETRSNTLYMEKELGWQGLLIEADPSNFDLLLKKNRKAWSANACLSLKPYPHEVLFMQQFNLGKAIRDKSELSQGSTGATPVLCLPLFTLLSYINVTTIDHFSLDVEGNELDILRTIPFDSVLIKTMSVEFLHVEGGKDGVLQFMKGLGYLHIETITHANNLANDFIFIHPSLSKNES